MRKTANYTVMDDNRDKGKLYLITEMSAAQAESWAMRVLLALVGSNVNLPDNFEEMGTAGLAEIGLKCIGGLKWDVAKPLLDEMMDCVQIIPDPRKTHVVRPLIDSDTDEVSTRLQLKVEVWKLQMDFLQAVAPSVFKPKAAAQVSGKPRIATSAK